MNKKIAFVGDTDFFVRDQAIKFDKSAFLIDKDNYHLVDTNESITFYTSLGDIVDDNLFWQILSKTDQIYYCPPPHWAIDKLSSEDIFGSTQNITEYILLKLHKTYNSVVNYNLITRYNNTELTKLVDTRRTDNIQLWVAGDSFTFGKGVKTTQRYGSVLADLLKVPHSTLAEDGSCISWASDQICRSDIRKNDIVVWGLTDPHRYTIWSKKNNWQHITSSKRIDLIDLKDFELSKNMLNQWLVNPVHHYQSVIAIHRVKHFCELVGAKLLIIGLLSNLKIEIELCNVYEFVQYFNNQTYFNHGCNWIDIGDDNLHPGPNQHKLFAKFCYNQLNQRYHIENINHIL